LGFAPGIIEGSHLEVTGSQIQSGCRAGTWKKDSDGSDSVWLCQNQPSSELKARFQIISGSWFVTYGIIFAALCAIFAIVASFYAACLESYLVMQLPGKSRLYI
jgi:hypothetical protein